MRDPALLQYVGRNTYEVRLYPVPPHATRKITLRYAEALRPEAGGARKYVYSFVADAMGGDPADRRCARENDGTCDGAGRRAADKHLLAPARRQHPAHGRQDGDRRLGGGR